MNVALESGDIVLMTGYGQVCSAIRFFTNSKFDHVGLIYKCPRTNQAYMWEIGSCPSGCGPIITKANCPANSAHLVIAANRITKQKNVSVRRIRFQNTDVGRHLQAELPRRFTEVVRNHIGRTYSSDVVLKWNSGVEFTASSIPIFAQEEELASDGWVCPQLVMETLELCGLGNCCKPSPTFLPGHFAKKSWDNEDFLCEDGVWWSEPESIK